MPTRLGDDRGLRAELTLMWAVVGLCVAFFLLGLRAAAPRPRPAVAKTSGTTAASRPPHHGAGYWKHKSKRRSAGDKSGD